ncbi:IS1096 element passenger TnpR family protein [Butyrivibrio sp. FC2001]|uniref:IS1096 element passenger TnpR family protein n=1 Tax=Butyrivibrio sp. FC2001 TaxID=1280671 RepID=UPI0004035686|nr:SEC-C metal-binding domain-containing protein [Butyrivibrio sp. FC2001]
MKAYQLKITIKNSKPPIWRRCIVPAGLSFSQLTVVLHKVMGWWEGHLSEYTFRNHGVKLLENADEYDGVYWEYEELDSSEYLIDEFFDDAKSFSYHYDFGDDWYHTVQIEKIIDDYEFDYPMVIKFKGDTPPEDCGGIWGYYELLDRINNPDDPEREELAEWFENQTISPYDMEWVNRELVKFKKTKKKIKPITEAELLGKQFAPKPDYTLNQVKVSKNRQHDKTRETIAEYAKAIKKINTRIEELVDFQRTADKNLRNTYGDTNVDEYYEFIDQNNNGEKKIKTDFDYDNWKDVSVTISKHQMQDLMLNLRDIDIKNYIKYLQIPDKAGTTKLARIKKLLDELGKHPEYYLYMFTKDEAEMLFDLYDGKLKELGINIYISDDLIETITISILMGLIEIKEKGSKAEIRFAQDAGAIIEGIRAVFKKSAKKLYKELDDFDIKLGGLIRTYGVVELDKIAPLIKSIWGTEEISKDVIRKTYLHCTMPSKVWTATDYLAGVSYVAMPFLDAQDIMKYRHGKLASDFNYRKFSKNDAQITHYDMTDIYHCWSELAQLFIAEMEFDEYELADHLDRLFMLVLNGGDAAEFFDVLCDIYPTNDPFLLSEFWNFSIECVLDTGIPHLMGYSRYEYYEHTGQRPQELPITSRATTGKKSKGPKAHLMYFPEDVHWELFEIRNADRMLENKEEIANRAEKLLEQYPDNLELMADLSNLFLAIRYVDRVEFLLRRIKRLNPDSVKVVNRMLNVIKKGNIPDFFEQSGPFSDVDDYDGGNFFGDEDFSIPQPIVREHPKIGRNDPCPCGSGKKFKKCCMGKGIYD